MLVAKEVAEFESAINLLFPSLISFRNPWVVISIVGIRQEENAMDERFVQTSSRIRAAVKLINVLIPFYNLLAGLFARIGFEVSL